MDRQLVNNLHQLAAKGLAANDGPPTTSRQVAKSVTRPNKQSKNGFARHQNKQLRGREPNPLANQFRDHVDSSRNYLAESSRHISFGKKHVNHKVSFKERFVQANCQFVMSAINDNSDHLKDPDLPINWAAVEEVLYTSANSEVCCPICLCQPMAAKITRCGHIYCWSCILHYLALSDKESRACPICFETVPKVDLKSVCIISKVEYAINDYLTFSLMKIRKNSTIALPAIYKTEDQNFGRLNRNTCQTLDQFGKIFTASSEYVKRVLGREKEELAAQLLEYKQENMPEICFVQNALCELEERQREFAQMDSLCQQFANFSLPSKPHNLNEDYIYFYQSDDGQAIYLHPLNVRMLKHEFGDLKNCPSSITAKIIELQWQSVYDDVRRRYAYLRHLPLSCEFKIAEVELEGSIISQATQHTFANEINNRKKDRKRKEKAQNIRDRKIEIENNRKIFGITPAPSFYLNNVADFPDYLAGSGNLIESDNWAPIDRSPSPELGSSPLPSTSPVATSSFAKMLSAAGGSGFNSALRKKPSTSGGESQLNKSEDEDGALVMQSMQVTLGDFLDTCIKTSKKRRKNKKV